MYIFYTPLRELIGSSDGKLEFGTMQNDRKAKAIAKQVTSLDGTAVVTTLHRVENIYTVSTVPITGTATRDKFREFNASVMAGETYSIDILGTEAVPVDAITVHMIPNSYRENYLGALIYSYTFKFKE